MNFISKIFLLIFSLRIDGLIDLGPKWTYEYRIGKDDELKNIVRTGTPQISEEESNESISIKEDDAIRKDEERLSLVEERLRKEAAALRILEKYKIKNNANRMGTKHRTEEKGRSPSKIIKHDNHKSLKKRKAKINKKKDDATGPVEEVKTSEPIEEIIVTKKSPKSEKVTFTSSDESFDSSEKKEESYEKTTKKHKRVGHGDKIYKEHDTAPNKSKVDRMHAHNTVAAKILPLNKIKAISHRPTQSTTGIVTTLRTGDIYTNPHRVKSDAKITEFTDNLFKQTLNVFDTVKKKTSQYHVKKEIDALAKNYEEKFKEFLRDRNSQKIKTRLGTQKVILNTIETSNRILKRLVNFMIGDMDKKAVLRDNMATAKIFQKEIETEQNLELSQACKNFGVCRTGNGFPEFIADVITIILRCDDRRFQQSIDALTEVLKDTNYYILDSSTERRLKDGIENLEMQPIYTLRPTLTIIRNIISNKNKPLVVNNSNANKLVNSTLAFLELIDIMEQRFPRNETNASEWSEIKTSLSDFVDSKRYDIQDIMELFVKHLKKSLKSLDMPTQRI
ncbi:hypothetical protein HF086_002790, partial [Spodoptera exigua]